MFVFSSFFFILLSSFSSFIPSIRKTYRSLFHPSLLIPFDILLFLFLFCPFWFSYKFLVISTHPFLLSFPFLGQHFISPLRLYYLFSSPSSSSSSSFQTFSSFFHISFFSFHPLGFPSLHSCPPSPPPILPHSPVLLSPPFMPLPSPCLHSLLLSLAHL